jgi:hypothetical protein
MEIEDLRKDSSWMPAVSILEEFIPKLNPTYFAGIKKVILLDKDYHKDKKVTAAARYVPIRGTNFAIIEFYLGHFSTLPEEAKQSRMYLTWRLLCSLAHELYHHRVRGQKKIRRPKFTQEQKNADEWAVKIVNPIFAAVYPKELYEEEWKFIVQKIRESQDKNLTDGVELTEK